MPRTSTSISMSQLKDFVKSKLVYKYNNDYKNVSQKVLRHNNVKKVLDLKYSRYANIA